MLIDCDTCTARPAGCQDCVVTHLLGAGPAAGRPAADLTSGEVAAVAVLAASGLVPPLRLTPPAGGAAARGRPLGADPTGRATG
ncbi:hypothetical protein [Aquipuribacter nitratireducens]|uniref:Uncharacterized protein n=1 Tax=Aquipuribacter nitratireducens TaxID=650104 RepID=A0ABW0GQM4_9MICO